MHSIVYYLFTAGATVSAIDPQEVGQLLIVDCSSNDSNIPSTESMIVGQPLILRCNVSNVRSNIDLHFIWSSNNTILRMVNVLDQMQDYYVISSLNTSNDGQEYQCEVMVDAIRITDAIVLKLDGKLSTNFSICIILVTKIANYCNTRVIIEFVILYSLENAQRYICMCILFVILR